MSNTHADANLEYLTVDSIQWATGHQRPRMPIEQKRAKHRVHQRQFMQRQRLRIEQLRRDVRRYTLQFQMLEAAKEAAALMRENAALQQHAGSLEPPLEIDGEAMPFQVYGDGTAKRVMSTLMPERDPEVAMLELLDMLPGESLFRVESPVDVDAFAWFQSEDRAESFAWPMSTSCATSLFDGDMIVKSTL